ncbi:MAG: alpha/beta hydrolase [Gemmatimonadota bacterium]|nr:alpha/beta hydrolase [Gemmatimonadota bacterium]
MARSWGKGFVGTVAMMLMATGAAAGQVGTQELLTRPPIPPDHEIRYGDGPRHVAHLRLPDRPGPHRVLIVIHGGCWLSFADLRHLDELNEELTASGWATWSVEYRPIDEQGGGWPGTFLDVAGGIDHLKIIADDHDLDLDRVAVLGHSAGGHLSLWAAGRARIPEGSELYRPDPVRPLAAVSLGGLGDLEAFHAANVPTCGPDIIPRLLGGTPEEHDDHYVQGSPARLLPLGVPQLQITGSDDGAVPPRFANAYDEAAEQAGDPVETIILDGAGHFDVVAPWSPLWPQVKSAVLRFLEEAVP